MESAQQNRSLARRQRWLWWTAGSLFLVLGAVTVSAILTARRAEPFLRSRIVDGLSSHFHARVELDTFHVALGNGLRGEWGIWAQGHGLRVWPPAGVADIAEPNSPVPSGEPLISLASFGFHVPLRYKPDQPIYVGEIRLQGLNIHLPPRSQFMRASLPSGSNETAPQRDSTGMGLRFQLGNVECKDATLILETSKPGKRPLEVDIARLKLSDIEPNKAMRFEAELTNPKPVGAIHAMGIFGPWQVADPGESPVAGHYQFDHADLSDFKGISGILSSTGDYAGTLRNITVDGETHTPDFGLTRFGNTMDLRTRFHAIVDGTNGDTHLDPVNATLGHSQIVARGQVVRAFPNNSADTHSIGHDIDLNIEINGGRIEDFLRLTSNDATPLLTGDLVVKSTLHIQPGKEPVPQRLGLKGKFILDQAQFASPKVQSRIEELSLRGQGRPHDAKNPNHEDIRSTMQSDFQMAGGVITLPDLAFDVPGAEIELKGTYTLDGGALGFTGRARLQATVSKMVGGWKGLLLKPADGLFKKNGAGTEVPIHVAGTYKNPEFGVDVKGIPHSHPQRPDQQAPPSPQAQTAAPAAQH